MAEGNAEDIDDKYKSRIEHGRYVLPWGGNRPSIRSALWWKLSDKNKSGVGGGWWDLWKFKEKVKIDLIFM